MPQTRIYSNIFMLKIVLNAYLIWNKSFTLTTPHFHKPGLQDQCTSFKLVTLVYNYAHEVINTHLDTIYKKRKKLS